MSASIHATHPSTLRLLVGSGDRIGLVALPFIAGGLLANALAPAFFDIGGPPPALRVVSLLVLIPGVANWLWCVASILRHVPRGELITTGPYALVKHPLYTGVALLVIPWVGFLCDSWVGVPIGIALYLGSRRFAPAEEVELAEQFGAAWDAYERDVLLPWL